MMNNSVIKKIAFTVVMLFLFTTIKVLAQPADPGGDPVGQPGGPVGTGVPLDGGSISLLVLGAVYGAKQLKGKGGKDKLN